MSEIRPTCGSAPRPHSWSGRGSHVECPWQPAQQRSLHALSRRTTASGLRSFAHSGATLVLRPEKGSVPSVPRCTFSSSLPLVRTQDQSEAVPAFEGLGGTGSRQDPEAHEGTAGRLGQALATLCVHAFSHSVVSYSLQPLGL